MAEEILLRATDVTKSFTSRGKTLGSRTVAHAVNGVSLEVRRGETLGIVGESGCGKSTLARCLVQLLPVTSGSIEFNGTTLTGLSRRRLRHYRKDFQLVFQDPYASLNPRRTVGDIVADPMRVNKVGNEREIMKRVEELFVTVGLDPSYLQRYPHEFSGGQRQRIGIARSLSLNPSLVIADEPVSALDVSVQAQVLNLMADLQEEFALTYVFIAHDLGVVRHVSDRVGVMYLGELVELGEAEEIYGPPHPPLHRGAPVGGARAERHRRPPPRADHHHRRRARPRGPAERVLLPSAVPGGHRALCRREADAGDHLARAPGGLPPSAQHRSLGRG